MNILLLGSQHGNELLGERLYHHIKKYHSDITQHITFRLGNPRARKMKVRYIESDMNRSYNPSLATYEARRAKIIEDDIAKKGYDLVLDLHTTTCVQAPCVIVAGIHPVVRSYLRTASIRKIVHLQHPIVATSLIGRIPHALSIEISNGDLNRDLFDALAQDLRRFIEQSPSTATKSSLYVVNELIQKSEVTSEAAAAFRNFELSAAGFIPILTGENSYKKNTHYLGFKAEKETIITL